MANAQLTPWWNGMAVGLLQIYASVAATMLALMDGVADRGAVIVLGATNRCAAHAAPVLALFGNVVPAALCTQFGQ